MCRLIVRAVNVCGVFCVVSVLWCCLMGRHRVARYGVIAVYYCVTALHRASRAAGVSVVCWRSTCVVVHYRTNGRTNGNRWPDERTHAGTPRSAVGIPTPPVDSKLFVLSPYLLIVCSRQCPADRTHAVCRQLVVAGGTPPLSRTFFNRFANCLFALLMCVV